MRDEQFDDWLIHEVNSYLNGTYKRKKSTRLDQQNITAAMEMAIRHACHIHDSGIEIGTIYLGEYKRERRCREKLRKRLEAEKT